MQIQDRFMDDITHLKSRVLELQIQLCELGPIMRGSVTMIGNKRKQPHFSVSMKGRTKLIYLGVKREAQAQEYTDNYKRLMEIVQEMTLVNIEILKLQGQLDKKQTKNDLST